MKGVSGFVGLDCCVWVGFVFILFLMFWFGSWVEDKPENKKIEASKPAKRPDPVVDVDFKYFIKRSKKSRNIAFLVPNDKEVIVRVPFNASNERISKSLRNNAPKIKKLLEKVGKKRGPVVATDFDKPLQVKDFVLVFGQGNSDGVKVKGREIFINFVDQDAKRMYKLISLALRRVARAYLPQRLDQLSEKLSLPYAGLRIKTVKTIWGSCSAKKNINLSAKLVLLDDDLIDYVIVHELVHTKHRHHGAAFWKYLSLMTEGRSEELDKRLSKVDYPLRDVFESASVRFGVD